MSGLPIPWICFQCGTDQNPCHCKVVGPTIGFGVAIALAVSRNTELPWGTTDKSSRSSAGQPHCFADVVLLSEARSELIHGYLLMECDANVA